ncbi:MAG: hypothetical protein FWF73_01760 [Spirochaetes bacterium]|nr:hypothetical protein [Spirochaetota bacterium]
MRFFHHYKVFLLIIFFLSCSSRGDLLIDNKVTAPAEFRYRLIEEGNKKNERSKNNGKSYIALTSRRCFVYSKSFDPESVIMRAGIEEALKGNFLEAETLFNEINENINDGSIENNQAIIFELTKREKEALAMYITALMKSPENIDIKNNLLAHIKDKKFLFFSSLFRETLW